MNFSKTERSLTMHGFTVTVFQNAEEAVCYLDKAIDACTVSLGGSMTLAKMRLQDRLSLHNTVYLPFIITEGRVKDINPVEAAFSEVFVTSANALAETGEIINIDGLGNRISSMLYGHKRVYFVIGRNKIEPDFERALWRARNIAAPKNAARLHKNTPCAVTGRCADCRGDERICRGLAMLWEPISRCSMEVLLIDEDLGF